MTPKKLDSKIEALELDKLSETEIQKVVAAMSTEGMRLRRARKMVRYKLYRVQTECMGGAAANVDQEFKVKFEDQEYFGGWRWFGITWDVAMDDPYRCVHRDKSVGREWDELIRAKFPVVAPGGKIIYPDVTVRKKVEANAKKGK